jgi:hypothetical protein
VLSWLIANVGDSRAYCAADGECHQVTSDHSYVQELVDAGEITAVQARKHPDRNVVTQALGVVDVVRPDFWVRPFRVGERFLLCSDGLSGELDDGEIANLLLSGQSPQIVAQELAARALAAGGHDNLSIIVVDVIGTPSDLSVSTETKPKKVRKRRKSADADETTHEATPLEQKIRPSALLDQLTIDIVPLDSLAIDLTGPATGQGLQVEVIEQAPISEDQLAELTREEYVEPAEVGPMIGAPPRSASLEPGDAAKGASEREP